MATTPELTGDRAIARDLLWITVMRGYNADTMTNFLFQEAFSCSMPVKSRR